MVGISSLFTQRWQSVTITIMLMLLYDGIMVVIVAVVQVVGVVDVLVVIVAVVAARRRPCSLHEVKL